MADETGVFESFESVAMIAPMVVSEVGILCSGGEDEGVVWVGGVVCRDFLILAVDVVDCAKVDGDVFCFVENGAQRAGDRWAAE